MPITSKEEVLPTNEVSRLQQFFKNHQTRRLKVTVNHTLVLYKWRTNCVAAMPDILLHKLDT